MSKRVPLRALATGAGLGAAVRAWRRRAAAPPLARIVRTDQQST